MKCDISISLTRGHEIFTGRPPSPAARSHGPGVNDPNGSRFGKSLAIFNNRSRRLDIPGGHWRNACHVYILLL